MEEKSLFELVKEVKKLGYTFLSFEEARLKLKIEPLKVSNYYFVYFKFHKKYLILNFRNTEFSLKKNLELFLKDISLNKKLKKRKHL